MTANLPKMLKALFGKKRAFRMTRAGSYQAAMSIAGLNVPNQATSNRIATEAENSRTMLRLRAFTAVV